MAEPGGDGALPTVAEVLSTTVLVSCGLDVCRRLVLSPEQVLLRVTHAPSGHEPKLDALRGHQLLQVCSGSTSTDINSENTLAALLELLDQTGQAPQIDEIDLVFNIGKPEPTRTEAAREKRNMLRDPDTPQADLTERTMLLHLQPVGFRKRFIKDLAQVPSNSCFYFSHKNWALNQLGAVLKLPANKVKELDLSYNQITHVGPELSRFEQMVDLRISSNGISEIELHYLPRLLRLNVSFNKLQALPELAGLPSLEELDLCDNQIGSRASEGGGVGSTSSSTDGWETLTHSDLQELKVLLLANNALKWNQIDFNMRIAVLSDKPSIEKVEFRGNPMLFSPRLDDLPPLEHYRPWIITHCKQLEMLDGEEIDESDHLYVMLNPVGGDAGQDEPAAVVDNNLDPERMPIFGELGQPRTTDLEVLSNMLAETFVLPAHLASETLDKVQRALSSLMTVPPTERYMFPAEELEVPVAEEVPAIEEEKPADDGQGLGLKEQRRRTRLDYETQLMKIEKTGESTGDLLADADISSREQDFEQFTLGTREGQKGLAESANTNDLIALSNAVITDEAAGKGGVEEGDGAMSGDEEGFSNGDLLERLNGAAYRPPSEIIDEFLQQLQIIFERAPKGHLVSSPELERHNAVTEALEQAATGSPPVVAKGEAISIGERAIRLLITCCTLMGDRRWGDVLAERAKALFYDLLAAAEEQEELIISQALSVLLPPILQSHCKDWVQFSNFQMLCVLVRATPLVGLQMTPLAQNLRDVLVEEEGTAPTPLFTLLGLLSNYEELFPRVKGNRPDSHFAGSPSRALHNAGLTTAVGEWLCGKSSTMKTWTKHRQLCVWQMAEGLACFVPASAVRLVEAGVAKKVKEELMTECRGDMTVWGKEKVTFVTQLILTAEAMGKHVNEARSTFYALPSRFGTVLGSVDEAWTHVYEDKEGNSLLTVLLPNLLQMPLRANAKLLAALLNMLATLVANANGAMLNALSEILSPVKDIIKLAQTREVMGYLEDIIRNAAHDKPETEHVEGLAYNAEPLATEDPDVKMMLLKLVEVITAYASRAEEYRKELELASLGRGPEPEAKTELALTVTSAFDEENRDQLIFRLLQNSTDEGLKIAAMECLSKVPVAALERSEVEELVEFVLEKVRLHEVYVGRNEELMVYAFNTFARMVRVPDEVNGRRSAGFYFRKDYGNLVQITMQLLTQNTARDIPESSGSERDQKGQLSQSLTAFLQACSGCAEGQEHEEDPPPVWPQAVSVLQMRDMTENMLEIMQNEENFGDSSYKISLEESALANKVEPILFTLESISIKSAIKARLLNRLAQLLEGEGSEAASPFELDLDGDGVPDGDTEAAKALRTRRIQHHVSFHRKQGIDLVLTQLEDQMSELRQELANAAEGDDDVDTGAGGAQDDDTDELIPRDAQPDAVNEKVAHVLKFVELEENRADAAITLAGGGGDEEEELMMTGAVKQFVDWHSYGEAALYSEELHLMEDIGEGAQHLAALTAPSAMLEAKKSEQELAEEEAIKQIWNHAEQSVAATLRILTACVKHGSTETTNVFLERMAKPGTQHDVLKIAGHVGVFTMRRESDAAFRFVELFREVLIKETEDSMVDTELLPLLGALGRLLPRLLQPYTERMSKALDTWAMARSGSKAARAAANDDLLRSQANEDPRTLKALVQIAGLYSIMLNALTEMEFSSTFAEVDAGAKELAMRRLLPPVVSQVTSQAGDEDSSSALTGFLSTLFYDAVLRMCEGWEPSEFVSKSNDSLARQEVSGAVKSMLASFCVLDEERRFELFQLTARLEARWTIQLSPAVMHAITDLTEHLLYKRALEPYLLSKNILEPEGEQVFEATWMVQEAPTRNPSTLVVVTNRAVYLLRNPRMGAVCSQCESWKLCPTGPKPVLRVPLYKITKVVIDFTAAFDAGHRIKICYTETTLGKDDNSAFSNTLSGCGDIATACACKVKSVKWNPFSQGGQQQRPKTTETEQEGGQPDDGATAGGGRPGGVPTPANPQRKKGGQKLELQFSSLLVGVAQKIALSIQAGNAHAPPDIVVDSFATRAIELQRAHALQKSKGKLRAAMNVNAFVVNFVPLMTFAMRMEVSTQNPEDLADNGSKPKELLLILAEEKLLFFEEDVALFGVQPKDDSSNVRHEMEGFKGDGLNSLKEVMNIPFEDITSLELELSAEPRARVAIEGKTLLLTFADDSGAMLWRYHMRNALWGTGKATWTGARLGGGHGGERQKSSRNDRGPKGLSI